MIPMISLVKLLFIFPLFELFFMNNNYYLRRSWEGECSLKVTDLPENFICANVSTYVIVFTGLTKIISEDGR